MRNEADRLLEELEHIRSNAGSTSPGHPKFKKWVSEVRTLLGREGTSKDLKRFEQLETVKGGPEMWSRDAPTPADLRKFKADLTKVEAVLKEIRRISESPEASPAHQKMVDLYITKEEEKPEDQEGVSGEVEEEIEVIEEKELPDDFLEEELKNLDKGESAMEKTVEPSFDAVTKLHLSSSVREQAIDRLMADLQTEMKRSNPDWDKIQGIMGDLMGLKKIGDLLDRLKTEIGKNGAKWESIREIMAQIWASKKELVVDLLPALLKG